MPILAHSEFVYIFGELNFWASEAQIHGPPVAKEAVESQRSFSITPS